MFNYNDVKETHKKIEKYIYKTPLEKSIYLSDENTNYFLKLECLQTVKSFKIRGALSKMISLTEEEKKRGVVAISSGNHGVAVSYAASLLNIESAEIIVPENTPGSKIDKIKYYGGNIKIVGKSFDDAYEYGKEYIKENKKTFIDAYYDDPYIYSGQGTVALEILEQNPEIDTIVVPIGGGGLITGISVAARKINPDIRIIGVQTAACPAMIKSIEEKVFYEAYPAEESVCDALIGGVGRLAYDMADECIDDIIEISEENIKGATSHMIKKEKFIAEPSSCTSIAAVINEKERIGGKNVALVISGGNINEELMVEILNKY
jgi:threonine dehydratase